MMEKVIEYLMSAVLAALVMFLLYDMMAVLLASGGLVETKLESLFTQIIDKALLKVN